MQVVIKMARSKQFNQNIPESKILGKVNMNSQLFRILCFNTSRVSINFVVIKGNRI